MPRQFGLDIIRVKPIYLYFDFTIHFYTWLVFEKHFLYPKLIAGVPLLEHDLKEIDAKLGRPWFVHKKSYCQYRAQIRAFWHDTCCQKSFEVRATECEGFQVFAKCSKVALFIREMKGYCIKLDPRCYRLLRTGEYNSLFDNGKYGCIVYGPLQFINHSCEAQLAIVEQGNHFALRYEYCGLSRDLLKLRGSPLTRGEQVLIKYCAKKHLSFVCTCGAKGCR